MELEDYNNLVEFIRFENFPVSLEGKLKADVNKRHRFKTKAEAFYIDGMCFLTFEKIPLSSYCVRPLSNAYYF